MAPTEVKDRLRAYFQDNILYRKSIDEFDRDESLVHNGHIDSIGLMSLVAFLEKTFDIYVGENEIIPQNFDTLNNIYSYVSSKVDSWPG